MNKTQAVKCVKKGISFLFHSTIIWGSLLIPCAVYAQNNQGSVIGEKGADEKMLSQYVQTKGNSAFVFDQSNVKQFWIDHSVISYKDSFDVLLEQAVSSVGRGGVPLKVQFINVDETMDCNIEVVSESKDVSFIVTDNNSKKITESSFSSSFINYNIFSSVLHLEDTANLTFFLKFNSKLSKSIPIKKIIFSFAKNPKSTFFASPGRFKITKDSSSAGIQITEDGENSFFVKGKQSQFISQKKFLIENNGISSSATIKNVGENDVTIYFGYALYSKNHAIINERSFPYKGTEKALNVVSSSVDRNIIVVDSYPEWKEGCSVVMNAKDDLSDVPNNSFIGKIVEAKKLEGGNAEIKLDIPLRTALDKGQKIRIHGRTGAYFYTQMVKLKAGEETVVSASTQKDNDKLTFAPAAFPKGAYYAVPLLFSFSTDPSIENTVKISDYVVSY